ncbi:hypothetical protein [Subtercola boreus]|uniref:SLAC1 family transporter n=1 Tax=Subtercola boreus TaxID=120213 RepID=UPI001559055C|nr:hypothetical protein [Subtercola boreus]
MNTLAIPFGLLGYAGTWNAARTAFGWEAWVTEPFWALATAALIWLIIAHTIRGRHTSSTLADQLRHPAQGPIAAIFPASVVLLGAHLYPSIPIAGAILVYSGAASGFVFAAWLTTLWIRKQVPVEAIHGGYFLPTVAAGYISAGAFAAIGNMLFAIAAFSMGTFFWIVIFTILLARLALVAPLPGPLTPTLAILAAPPAVGGMAWLAMNGRTLDWVTVALLGATIFMVLIQIALIPTYRKLTFTLGFWSFTFSMAAVASQTIVLSDLARYPGWQVVAIAALAAVSVLIIVIAIKSLTAGGSFRRRARQEERQITQADDLVARSKSRSGV